jgi:hypothetical protein
MEPYGPGVGEYAAGQCLPRRALAALGPRFADHVVVDGEFATAPFLHAAGDLHLRMVARLKGNLPELFQAAQNRFRAQPPTSRFWEGRDRVEVWDADDFDPLRYTALEDRPGLSLPAAKTRWNGLSGFLVDGFSHLPARQPLPVPPGQEPLGDRESRVQ